MQNNIRNTNLRFNLDKEQQRRAWKYLQTMDRQDSFPDTDRKLSGNKKEIKKNNLAIRGSKEPLSPYGKFQNVFLSEKEFPPMAKTTDTPLLLLSPQSRLCGDPFGQWYPSRWSGSCALPRALSAVAASAYMSCSRMYNDYDGKRSDP